MKVQMFFQDAWIAAKTRITFWWWIVKYRGRKNIPPEIVFSQLEKTMADLKNNLMNAWRAFPQDISEEEKKKFFEMFSNVQNLETELTKAKKEPKGSM